MRVFLWKSLHILLTLLAGFLILLLLIIGIASTQTGFRSLLMLTQPWLRGQGIDYSTRHMQGDLYHFILPSLSLETARLDLQAQGIEISWVPWELFHRRVIITHAYIQQLTLTPHPGTLSNQAMQFHNGSLQVNQLRIAHIQWNTPQAHTALGSLQTRFSISQNELHVKTLALTGPIGVLRGHFLVETLGEKTTTGALDWSLTLPFSHPFYTSGHLGISGTLDQYHVRLNTLLQHQGTETLAAVEAEGDLQHLTLQTLSLKQPHRGSLDLQGTLVWSPVLNWNLTLKAHQLDLSPWIPALPNPITGHLTSFRNQTREALTGTLEESPYALSLSLEGQVIAPANLLWQDTLSALSLQIPDQTWQLTHPRTLTHSADFKKGDIPELCLHTPLSHLCTEIQWNQGRWAGQLHAQDLRIPSLTSMTQTGHNTFILKASGMNAQILHATLTGTLNHYALTPIHPQSAIDAVNPGLLNIKTGTFHLLLNHTTLTANLDILESNLGTWHSTLDVHNIQNPNSPLSGSLTLHLTHLSPLTLWAPWIYHLEGEVTGHITLSGTRASPALQGHITLRHGSMTLPSLGLRLHHIVLALSGDHTQKAILQGELTSGEGHVQISGVLTALFPAPSFTLQFEGHDVTLLDLPLGFVIGSPHLTYTQAQHQGHLRGTLNIPKAFFNGDAFHLDATASPDVVYVNQDNQIIATHPPFPFFSDLTLTFGPEVTFEGFGVSAKVAGQLTLLSSPEKPAIGIGKLTSQGGTYQAYGKVFHITQGTLDFAHSPLENPGVDITAKYQLSPDGASNHLLTQLEIGVRMTGTLTHRILTLFSNPALSQEDILSYIVLGQPMSQVQQSDQSALSKAAALFVLQGGNRSVLTDIQSKLGLSQLTIGSLDNGYTNSNGIPVQSGTHLNGASGTAQDNNTAVFIGKSLNPNLYLSYGVGLFNRQQEVSLSLNLDRHWTLKTTGASQDSGVDLIYTILKA